MARECLAWQARSAAHRLAFERCTDTWPDIPALTLGGYAAAVDATRPETPDLNSAHAKQASSETANP